MSRLAGFRENVLIALARAYSLSVMNSSLWPAVLGAVLIFSSLLGGIALWFPAAKDPSNRASLGIALVGGGVIALAIFFIQIYADERRQQDVAAQNLRLTLGLSPTLRGIDLSDTSLRGIYLASRNLSNAQLDRARLQYANLSGANLASADASSATMMCANLTLARIANAQFVETDLRGAQLVGADATNAKLFGADLRGADLTRAILVNADLVGADLRDADVSSANLLRADLTDAALEGLRYDERTLWPAKFDPPDSGVTLPESDCG